MSPDQEYRDLGMHRRIPRRDFLGGVAIGITGACAAAATPSLAATALSGASSQAPSPPDPSTYPPARTGLRGQYPAAVEDLGRIRDGAFARLDDAVDTSE